MLDLDTPLLGKAFYAFERKRLGGLRRVIEFDDSEPNGFRILAA